MSALPCMRVVEEAEAQTVVSGRVLSAQVQGGCRAVVRFNLPRFIKLCQIRQVIYHPLGVQFLVIVRFRRLHGDVKLKPSNVKSFAHCSFGGVFP